LLDSPLTSPEKSNTAMYIGIGVGILAIGIVAIVLIKRNK
jgi:LPXTG-motif cell wall-anchored protein